MRPDHAPRYVSTRGGPPVPFREALLRGLAPDGGLYVPEHIPALPPGALDPAIDFPERGRRVLARWLTPEIPQAALGPLVEDALSFPVPLVPLRGGEWDGVHVLELFHGPTLSFKDFGARTMARLMGHFLQGTDRRLTILVATSGDTGSAVADGFAGQDRIRVVLLYPKGQVSAVQERQLVAVRPGVRTFAVDGTFDDCQRMVKSAFVDPALRHLSSANSINIGRLLPQMLYYVEAVAQGGFDAATVCVPSGNLGNLTGGVMAALGGLPVQRFVAAHNANDFFPRFLAGGPSTAQPASVRTLSNAMDVGVPSNFERLRALLPEGRLRTWVQGARVSDAETRASMQRVYEATGYVADPHTAVGLEAVRRRGAGRSRPAVVLATAHPAKFPETVREALGVEPSRPARLARLWDHPVHAEALSPTAEALRGALLDLG